MSGGVNYNMGPAGVVGRPTMDTGRESRVFTDGMVGTNTLKMPLPGANVPGGPSMNASYARGRDGSSFYDAGVQNTNGFTTYAVAQKTVSWVPGDTAPGLVTFMRRPVNPDSFLNQRQMSYAMFGLPEQNRRLRHEHDLRVLYGSQLSSAKLQRDYACIGVQQSKQTLLNSRDNYNEMNNFIIRGRCRMPNLWLAQATRQGVVELDVLYLLLRRHKYHGNDVLSAATWDDDTRGSGNKRARTFTRRADGPAEDEQAIRRAFNTEEVRDQRAREKEATTQVNLRASIFDRDRASDRDLELNTSAEVGGYAYSLFDTLVDASNTPVAPAVVAHAKDAVSIESQSDQAAGRAGDYYWSWDPWVSHDRQPPHPSLYSGSREGDPDNQYTGDFMHVGQLIHISKGENNPTQAQIKLARRALYTKTRSVDYYEPLRQLDECEVHIGFGRGI